MEGVTVKMADLHRPENCTYVKDYRTARGRRFVFRVPSSSVPTLHQFQVDADGTRPFCNCIAFRMHGGCTLSRNPVDVLREYWRRHYYDDLDLDPAEFHAEDERLRATFATWTLAERIQYAGLGDAIAGTFGTLEEHDPYIYGPEGPPQEVQDARNRAREAVTLAEQSEASPVCWACLGDRIVREGGFSVPCPVCSDSNGKAFRRRVEALLDQEELEDR